MTPSGIKEECTCGHDRASHYLGLGGDHVGSCLVAGCDPPCPEYTHKHRELAHEYLHHATCVCATCAERRIRLGR